MTTLALLTFDFLPHTGGVQRYLFEIFSRIAEEHHVTVVTPVEGSLPASKLSRRGVKSTHAFAFLKVLRDLKPQVVVVGHSHPQLLIAARLYGKPYFTIAYGNDYKAAQLRWHRPVFNFLLKYSTAIIAISNHSANDIKLLTQRDPHIVHPGVNASQFAFSAESRTTPLLLTVGRLVPRKGVDTVILAIPAILRAIPEMQYAIVGDGPYRSKLESLAQSSGVSEQVTFFGRIEQDALQNLYNQAAIFIMPVREEKDHGSVEGFGIVFLEANACGIPVIAGRSGGAVDAVKHGETGLLITPDSATETARAVIDLWQDMPRRKAMGIAGRQWVEEEMSWDHAAIKFADHIRPFLN